MYYATIVDILILLWKHKFTLTLPLVGGICWAIGKRHGVKFAVNYIMKTFRLEKKSVVEQQLAHHEQQIIQMGGQPWSASISKPYKLNIRLMLSKCSIRSQMGRSIARYTKQYTSGRKKMSRKLLLAVFGTIVMVLSQFGITLDPETIIGMGTLVISAIVGQAAVDTNGLGQYAPLKVKLQSKKLWTALLGSVFIVLNDYYSLGVSPDIIYWIVGILVAFILGRSAVSVVQASKNAGGTDEHIEPTITIESNK